MIENNYDRLSINRLCLNEATQCEFNEPCPFCGHDLAGIFGPHPDLGTYYAQCDNLSCPVDYHIAVDTMGDALLVYNTRAYTDGDYLRVRLDQVISDFQDMHSTFKESEHYDEKVYAALMKFIISRLEAL